MEFCEDDTSTIELVNYNKSLIYFLLQENEVVYVGQSTKGFIRPLSHTNKDYNRIIIMFCDKHKLDYFEDKFIMKYKPMYNYDYNKQCRISLDILKRKILQHFKLTTSTFTLTELKKLVKVMNIDIVEINCTPTVYINDIGEIYTYVKNNGFITYNGFNKELLNIMYKQLN